MLRRAGVLGFLAVALLATGCGSEGIPSESGASEGKQLFVDSCGTCHVIGDAGTKGRTGPNLDDAFAYVRDEGFDESTIRALVRSQIAYPVEDPVTGEAGMPANILEGDDADAVAAYVASVAGTEASLRAAAGGTKATDGKSIFTSAGCVSCHTLADAGSTGTVGPNLDQAKPSEQLAIERVTNGKGAMPSFKDDLNEAQIKAVAKYVSQAAGK